MKKRIFIAINLPEDLKNKLGNTIKKLQVQEPGIKWIKPENAHFTLAFLGEITEEQIAKITAILKILAKNQKKFELNLENFGFFPSAVAPRVLCLGTGENFNLLNLQNNLQNQIHMSGFGVKRRVFSPHLTIGRVKKDIKNIDKIIKLTQNINLGKFLVSSIDIMESILKKEGPEYKIVFKVNLKESTF